MCKNWYGGFVPMKPEMDKRELISGDDDFTYKTPKICFECNGETDDSFNGFEWKEDSIIIDRDNRVVKYVEYDNYEFLVADIDGHTEWLDGRIAEFLGFDMKHVKEVRKVESHWIEEYDWEKSIKKRYRLVLEEASNLEEYDSSHVKEKLLCKDPYNDKEYVMPVSEYL